MLQKDAFKILGLIGEVSPEIVRKAWIAATRKYHPDVNSAGLEMMKAVNVAYETLKDFTGTAEGEEQSNYADALNDALNAIIDLDGLDIEICGAWLWVGGNTREHKEALKAHGFRYASKKKKWNFRPADWKSASRGKTSMDEIREKFGSVRPARKAKAQGARIA